MLVLLDSCFAAATLIASLYLVLCYIPITLIGFIQHPLFTWVPRLGHITQMLYLPLFVAALLASSLGKNKSHAQSLAKIFVAAQVLIGLVALVGSVTSPRLGSLYFVARPLLFGPDLTAFLGPASYLRAICCLVPMLWLGIVKIWSSFPFSRGSESNSVRLTTVLSASLAISLLYAAGAKVRYGVPGRIALSGMLLSFFTHAAFIFALWQAWLLTEKISCCFKNSRLVRFVLRVIGISAALSIAFRRIVLGALGFNNRYADLYALALSVSVVVYVAGSILQNRRAEGEGEGTRTYILKKVLLVTGIALIYVAGLKASRFDWNELFAGTSALLVIIGAICLFCVRPAAHAMPSLSRLALGLAGGLALTGASVTPEFFRIPPSKGVAAPPDTYALYDPSLSLVRKLLSRSTNDGAYADFYGFLNSHANIQQQVPAPLINLVKDLAPSKGEKPHIFLFVIDALRKDYLSPYNPRVAFTPAIQAFADDSVVFTNAMTPYGGSALAEPAIWEGVQQIHKHYPYPMSQMNALSKMLETDGYHSYIAYDFITQPLVPRTQNVTGLRDTAKVWQEKEFGPVLAELEDDIRKGRNKQQPIFCYSQPVNVHSLVVGQFHDIYDQPHAGFHSGYVAALENVDQEFGEFVSFLKAQGMYDNSIIILTADHGQSLGEWGRWGHISIAPEILKIPLIVHLPSRLRSKLLWHPNEPAFLQDITPTLYYLLEHKPLVTGEMYGRTLFTSSSSEQPQTRPDHFLLMSSYLPVFGVLSGDLNSLYIVDAGAGETKFFDLQSDPSASINKVTPDLNDNYQKLIRQDLERIDAFYHVSLGH